MKHQNFLQYVCSDLKKKHSDLSKLAIIFPNRRSIIYFNNHLSKKIDAPIFGPFTSSVDDFFFEVTGFNKIDNLTLFFEFYEEYTKIQKAAKTIENCLKWADTLLKDFDEIDKYLVDKKIFKTLLDFKKLDNWDLGLQQKIVTNDYISFFENLELLYTNLKNKLKVKKSTYSGLAQRTLAEDPQAVHHWLKKQNLDKVIFVGLAGMTSAEEKLIDFLYKEDLCEFYWDIDKYFFYNKNQEAGFFARKYFKKWNQNESQISDRFFNKKNINIIGANKLVGQSKLLGDLLSKTSFDEESITQTAVVLADESLLFPVLESIPKKIKDINVTLGMSLSSLPIISLFEDLFTLYIGALKQNKNGLLFHYKNILNLIQNPYLQKILYVEKNHISFEEIESSIKKEKLSYVNCNELKSIFKNKNNVVLDRVFNNKNINPYTFIEMVIFLIDTAHVDLDKKNEFEKVQADCLKMVKENFIFLRTSCNRYTANWTLNVLLILFKKMIKTQKINFEGEPVRGLQIMGLLETRNLDFTEIYVLSVNEEKIPSPKKQQISFFPFELKKNYGIATYIESDAIYANHFFNLIKNPSKSFLIYDKDFNSDIKSSERSRFIEQIKYEINELDSDIVISEKIVNDSLNAKISLDKKVMKDSFMLERIRVMLHQGISPSTLNSYFYDRNIFYLEKILNIKEENDLESSMRSDTIGNVMHDVLEELYTPYKNKFLYKEDIDDLLKKLDWQIKQSLSKEYKIRALDKGKNVLIYSAINKMLTRFLKQERKQVIKGNKIKILSLESEYKIDFHIEGFKKDVFLKGKIDRIDDFNGIIRIIDYKSGNMLSSDLSLSNMDQIKDKPKSLQVLFYALLYSKKTAISNLQSGIIPLKSRSTQFLPLNYNSNLIDQNTLNDFSSSLQKIIIELMDPNIPLIE